MKELFAFLFFISFALCSPSDNINCLFNFSAENFSSVESSNDTWLIKFYAGWAKDPLKLGLLWNNLAKKYCSHSSIHIGQIDM